MELKPDEELLESFIRAQELMTQLNDVESGYQKQYSWRWFSVVFPADSRFLWCKKASTRQPTSQSCDLDWQTSKTAASSEMPEMSSTNMWQCCQRESSKIVSQKASVLWIGIKQKVARSWVVTVVAKRAMLLKMAFWEKRRNVEKKGLLDVACRSQLSEKCSVHKRDAQSLHSVHLCSGTNVVSKEKVLIDSGCADHILTERNFFQSFRKISSKVKNPDGSFCQIEYIDGVEIKTKNGVSDRLKLKDVLLVPNSETNLLSLSKMNEKGPSVEFSRVVRNWKLDEVWTITLSIKVIFTLYQ